MPTNVAPVAPNTVIQCILKGRVAKDAPVPPDSPLYIPVVNVFNYLYSSSSVFPNPTVQGVTGIGASFFTQVFTPLIAALNIAYVADNLIVRSLTNPAFPFETYLDDGAAGHIIHNVAGSVTGEDLPMNASAVVTAVFTAGKGNNGKLRKSFGPLSASDTLAVITPVYNRDRISLAAIVGNTGRNWLAMKAAVVASLTDASGNWVPWLFSRNQSVLTPVVGPPIIRGWEMPGGTTGVLSLTIGSLKHRIERQRVYG